MTVTHPMQYQMSDAQIANFQENGFLVIENFLESSELADWRANVDEAVAERLSKMADRNTGVAGDKWGSDYYSQVFLQCIRLADTHEGMKRLMFDERLGQMAGDLAQADGIRIWHDQALIKPPYGNPTAWHLDNPYWSFTSKNAISLWVALDDATLANGCMWYLPGTHKLARFETCGIGSNMRDIFKVYPEWEKIEAVACPCPAGSAVLHHGLVAHGAGTNMTPRPRRAMTCGYMPDGSQFNGTQNVLPQEMFDSLQIGDVMQDEEQNPLIWRRASVAVA